MIMPLSISYKCRDTTTAICQVDVSIFTKTYYAFCMQCEFCRDGCCFHGVDISANEINVLERHAAALGVYLQISLKDWFNQKRFQDVEYAGGMYGRTRVQGRGCVFLSPAGRKCLIHSFALENGVDYHILKPMICCLFPITFEHGLLRPAFDVQDQSLICLGEGLSIYRGSRSELLYYYGKELLSELDQLESTVLM